MLIQQSVYSMQIVLDLPEKLTQQLTTIPDINRFAEQWLRYGLENTQSNYQLNITSAFGLVQTTETATLEQIEQAIQQGADDSN